MAEETPYRQAELHDVTKTTLRGLAQHENLDSLVAFLNGMKEARSGVRTGLAVAVGPAEGPDRFEAQHAKAIEALKAFGMERGAPTWGQVKAGLNAEVLRKTVEMQEPMLLLTPALTPSQAIAAIDAQHKEGKFGLSKKEKTYVYKPGDTALYVDADSATNLAWKVQIVEGKQNVSQNKDLQCDAEGNPLRNYEQVIAMVKHITSLGLDVFSGACDHLALMVRRLGAGEQPIDTETWTVLNAHVVANDTTHKSLLGYGNWGDVQVYVNYADPDLQCYNLRLRSAVRVNV